MSNRSDVTRLPIEAYEHYAESGYEARRLEAGTSQLEFARTKQILEDHLPPTPACVVDAGGGTGAYACWLARKGYEVHFLDAVDLHVDLARQASLNQPDSPLASVQAGDARHLPQANESADAVLLMGPMYHIVDRSDRLAVLSEARRVVRPGGPVVIATISRFASAMDGLFRDYLQDPGFEQIVEQDLSTGQHRNPSGNPFYFTTAYFHEPQELAEEVVESGLVYESTLAVEGPAGLLQNFDHHWSDSQRRNRLMALIRRLEREPSLLGVSSHLIGIARRAA